MEELKTTEILDREILEDARKKALRILKSADETVRTEEEALNKETAAALSQLKDSYQSRLSHAKSEISARLPLDKLRIELELVQARLTEAVQTYCVNLSRTELLSIVERAYRQRLAAYLSNFSETEKRSFFNTPAAQSELQNFTVGLTALSESEAQGILKRSFSAVLGTKADRVSWVFSGVKDPQTFPALLMDSRPACIRVSVQDEINTLLEDKRQELVAALMGEQPL
ncbi:hypothetical protein ACYULU_10370 [Breznakiellaceae bacterium SP9]